MVFNVRFGSRSEGGVPLCEQDLDALEWGVVSSTPFAAPERLSPSERNIRGEKSLPLVGFRFRNKNTRQVYIGGCLQSIVQL